MAVLTGFEGSLYYAGSVVAHVRNWSLTVTRDVIETTSLGDGDRTYVQGLRGATGTATILYANDLSDAQYGIWNEIFRKIDCDENKDPKRLAFQFDRCKNENVVEGSSIGFAGYVTSFTHSVSVGEAQAATINFTATGPLIDRNGSVEGNPYPD